MKVVSIDNVQLAMPAGREAEACVYAHLFGVAEQPKPLDAKEHGART
jgi:hypothetical protein